MTKWADRAVTVGVTILLGVSAQALLTWQEIAILTHEVQTQKANNKEMAQQLKDTAQILARLEERLTAVDKRMDRHDTRHDRSS